jgi:formylglycine-generating enzyme required for sulfatase activity
LFFGLALSVLDPFGLIPSSASPSASARIIKKLKKQIKTLKAQLAAARTVPPAFIEMVTVGNPGNAVDPSDGDSGSLTYAVIGTGTRPVTYVSWFDAARFCNWLHNGRSTGAQTAATRITGRIR